MRIIKTRKSRKDFRSELYRALHPDFDRRWLVYYEGAKNILCVGFDDVIMYKEFRELSSDTYPLRGYTIVIPPNTELLSFTSDDGSENIGRIQLTAEDIKYLLTKDATVYGEFADLTGKEIEDLLLKNFDPNAKISYSYIFQYITAYISICFHRDKVYRVNPEQIIREFRLGIIESYWFYCPTHLYPDKTGVIRDAI